jgi:glycosyltransferase involved in cell wall biosynthesis
MVIVIPCYKEARRIDVDEFVRVSEFFQTAVFVDDGSSDETFERLSLVKRRMTASGGHALVERLPQNVGKGEAVARDTALPCRPWNAEGAGRRRRGPVRALR